MTKLTAEQIETFASRNNVISDAVWNFLGTAHYCGSYPNALANLEMDAKLYWWNEETVKAIEDGLVASYKN